MKIKLVMDMPEMCADCIFCDIRKGKGLSFYCKKADDRRISNLYKLPVWCPLKECEVINHE